MIIFNLILAKKLGATDFINPDDYDKPIQQVRIFTKINCNFSKKVYFPTIIRIDFD